MPNRCYRGAKVLHFSGKRVGRRAESDAVACVAASPLLFTVVVGTVRFAHPLHVQNAPFVVFLLAKRLAVAKK